MTQTHLTLSVFLDAVLARRDLSSVAALFLFVVSSLDLAFALTLEMVFE